MLANTIGKERHYLTRMPTNETSPTLFDVQCKKERKSMSKVYLSDVESSSKLDSYTGLPVSSIDDGLGSSKSSPFLLEWSPESKRNKPTPLLGGVLLKNAFKFSNEPNLDELEGSRFSARRLSTSLKNLDEVDGPSGVNSKGAHGDGRDSYHSSFGDLLQSRDSDEHQELMVSADSHCLIKLS